MIRPRLAQALKGHVLYLLIIVVALNISYPITLTNTLGAELYVYAYCLLLGLGAFVASVSHHRFLLSAGGALITLFLVLGASSQPENDALGVIAFLALVIFQAILIFALMEFIFTTRSVTLDVLYAAITVYLLLGNTFAALYGAMERIQPGSFIVSKAPEAVVSWAQFMYFSFATLTTLGFGDIVPLTPWSESLVVFEAVVGVLYLTVMMSRLVGLYANDAD